MAISILPSNTTRRNNKRCSSCSIRSMTRIANAWWWIRTQSIKAALPQSTGMCRRPMASWSRYRYRSAEGRAGDVHIFQTDGGRDNGRSRAAYQQWHGGRRLGLGSRWQGLLLHAAIPGRARTPECGLGFYQQVYYHKLGTRPKRIVTSSARTFRGSRRFNLTDERAGRVIATVQNGDGGEFALSAFERR